MPRRKKTVKYFPFKRSVLKSKTFYTQGQLKIIPLGGLEEVGRNSMIFEYDKDIIIVDMGLQFPEEDMPGIDYIIPNISYLKGKENNIKAVIITHGHYDHIGAIPHIMSKIGNPPLYTGCLTAALIQKRQEEFKNLAKLNIQIVDPRKKIRLSNNFQIEFFRVNHNIPDSFGVVIYTPLGSIVHTGDFKFDHNPVNDEPADLNHLAQIGAREVLALLSDSTDAEHKGHQISESKVGEELEIIFSHAPGRIIIGTFASLISRIQQIISITEKTGRFLLVEGRSMNTNIDLARRLGYLKIKPKTIIERKFLKKIPSDRLVILCTGAQGERSAALMRIANDEHRDLKIQKNDTVIFSSSVIPGNERTIQNLKDTFVRQGAKIIHWQMMDIHAGGHAKQEDLKLMIRLIKPKYFIPIEANRYMLEIHATLAKSVGIPEGNIFVADNGQIIEFKQSKKVPPEILGKLTDKKAPANYVMVDGLGVGDTDNIVLRDRRVMAQDGMLVAIVIIESKTGELIGSPDIISRGFVYMKGHKELIERIRKKIKKITKDKNPRSRAFDNYIKDKIRNSIGDFLFTKTRKRPMILPVIIKV